MIEIATSARNPKETKRAGMIPAVYYGAHAKSTPIFIDEAGFRKAYSQAGESSSILLKTEHGNENAMIHEVQHHPVKGFPTHVDFYIVEKGQKVHVNIPITFIGESEAVKSGGILVKVVHELSVEGEPDKLPHEINVDISSLKTKDSVIHVKDISLPNGVNVYHLNEEDIVAAISEAKEESDQVAPVDLSQIEVVEKGKKETEAETTE